MTTPRQVLGIPGVRHNAPIPLGVRAGNLIWTSAMMGMDPATGQIPDAADRQAALLFDNLARLLEAGGATYRDITHATAFIADNSYRDVLNQHWTAWYPEEADRPARHTIVGPLPQNVVMQMEIVAAVDGPMPIQDDGARGDLIGRLATRSTATLHEASGGYGYVSSTIQAVRPGMRLCGPALPVQCAPGDNGWIHRALYVAEAPGSVLVVTVGEGREAGYWGAVLTEAAIARGVRGLVIDGCVRDADEIAALGFPVFAAGVSILGTTKDPAAPGSIGAPIQLGRSRVASGDVIVGDGDGLVVIERERAEAVFDRAVERDDRERGYIAALRSGATTIDLFAIEAPAPPGRADPWLDRLDRVEQRLLAHAHAALPSGLTPPDTATGEQWDAGQVWAHLAEFGQYWLDELQLVLDAPGDAPPAFGRVKSNAARVAAIAAGRHRTSAEQVVVMQDAIDRLRRMLQGMAPADWDRVGRHQTLGDLDVDAQLQHFHVGHYEEHADQLDGLTAP